MLADQPLLANVCPVYVEGFTGYPVAGRPGGGGVSPGCPVGTNAAMCAAVSVVSVGSISACGWGGDVRRSLSHGRLAAHYEGRESKA
jgi:hypothetical protein